LFAVELEGNGFAQSWLRKTPLPQTCAEVLEQTIGSAMAAMRRMVFWFHVLMLGMGSKPEFELRVGCPVGAALREDGANARRENREDFYDHFALDRKEVGLIDRPEKPNEIPPRERTAEASPSRRSCGSRGFDKAAARNLADRAAASGGIPGSEEAKFLQSWIQDCRRLIPDHDWPALP
jgi:hypothetical protein